MINIDNLANRIETPNNDIAETAGELFDERELRLIDNCTLYATNDPAGLPGHKLMLIINKLYLFNTIACEHLDDEDYKFCIGYVNENLE